LQCSGGKSERRKEKKRKEIVGVEVHEPLGRE
jgi:hypothetical protein